MIYPKFVELSKGYNLNPIYLQAIFPLAQKGYSNVYIANLTGISRSTVNMYLSKIKNMENEDFWKLVAMITLFAIGTALVSDIIGKKN